MSFRIDQVLMALGRGAYYYEDVSTLQKHSIAEDARLFFPAETPGFKFVREPAEVLSIGLTSGGKVYWGDAVSVSYGGKSGRKGVFRAEGGKREMEELVNPWLIGREFSSFREACKSLKDFSLETKGPLHVATLYGLSQALLAAASGPLPQYKLLAREWQLSEQNLTPLPLQGSCGNNFHNGSRKMLAHRVAVLPHGQVDDIDAQVGRTGDVFIERLAWLKATIAESDYQPTVHMDLHGALGKIFDGNMSAVGDLLLRACEVVAPYPLRIESPVLGATRAQHLAWMMELKEYLAKSDAKIELVIDEWANTLEDIEYFVRHSAADMIHVKMPDLGVISDSIDAVLLCRAAGVRSLLGGSCVETDLSVAAGVAAAMVSRPDAVLARPGMGIDESLMMVGNQMARIASESQQTFNS